jgi:hypothetical protein
MSETLTRREFVTKIAAGTASGIISGFVIPPLGEFVDKTFEDTTHISTKNAFAQTDLQENCPQSDPQAQLNCAKSYYTSTEFEIDGVIKAPLIEESLSRLVPSTIIGQNDNEKNLKLSRRELIVGVITSLFFGFSHNYTGKKIDMNSVPAAQITGGGILWYLQRKFGFGSNMLAHMIINQNFINSIKNL